MSKTFVLVAAAIVAVAYSLPSSDDDWVEKSHEAFPEATATVAAAKTCYVHPSDISCSTGGAGSNWPRITDTSIPLKGGVIDNSEAGLDLCAKSCINEYNSDHFSIECPWIDSSGNAKATCNCQSTSSLTTTEITKTDVSQAGKVDEALCRGSKKDKTFWYINSRYPDGRSSHCSGDADGKYVTSGYAMGAADVGPVYKTTKEACPATMDRDYHSTPEGCTFRNTDLEKAAKANGFCSTECGSTANGGDDFGSWTKDFKNPKKNDKCAVAKCEWCICAGCPECNGYTRSADGRKPDCSGS